MGLWSYFMVHYKLFTYVLKYTYLFFYFYFYFYLFWISISSITWSIPTMDEFSPAHPRLLQSTAPIQPALIRFESSTVQYGRVQNNRNLARHSYIWIRGRGGNSLYFPRWAESSKKGSKKLTGCPLGHTKPPRTWKLNWIGLLDCPRKILSSAPFAVFFPFPGSEEDINNETSQENIHPLLYSSHSASCTHAP